MFGAIAWGALGGTQLDHESTKNVPMQRGARSVFCRSVPMQRGARFSFFDVPMGGPRWVQWWRPKRYKNNDFSMIFKNEGLKRAANKWMPKSKMCKICQQILGLATLP